MSEIAPAAMKRLADRIVDSIPSAKFSGIVGDKAHT